MYYVYVIKNPAGRIYIGQTIDIVKRIQRHNCLLPNKSSSFTAKNKGPWRLVYSESHADRNLAKQREKFLKGGHGWVFIKTISQR